MLVNDITAKRIDQYLSQPAHALALVAPNGAGKGFLASYIACQLLNVSDVTEHPYVKTVNVQDSKVGIDEVREIQKFLTLTVPGKQQIKRVIVIQDADNLGHEAQNALLKTLEEPPQDTVIIITYANEHQILQTIRSRVHLLNVLPVSLEHAKAELTQPEPDIVRAYHISSGYVGLLMALLSGNNDHYLVKAIAEARNLLQLTRFQRLSKVDKLAKDKETSPKQLVDALYRLLSAGYHQSVKSKSIDELKPIANRLKLTEQALKDLNSNVQAKLVLSRLFMQL